VKTTPKPRATKKSSGELCGPPDVAFDPWVGAADDEAEERVVGEMVGDEEWMEERVEEMMDEVVVAMMGGLGGSRRD
jgi:hypothetical protein